MDREPEELQFLGFFGIFSEAYNIIVSRRKIFSQITLAFILPLSFIYLAQTKISDLLSSKIIDIPKDGLPSFFLFGLTSEFGLIKFIRYGLASQFGLLLLRVMYHIFLLVFFASLYIGGCLYNCFKVISVVPTVWKRLMITFLWTFLIMFLYNLFTILMVLSVIPAIVGPSNGLDGLGTYLIIGFIGNIGYGIGFIYISMIWHLASVVSVLEKSYGYKAILKSKIWIASVIFITLQTYHMIVLVAFDNLVANGRIGIMGKVSLGVFCFLLLSILIHFALVVQTIVYLVCKSYHHENIDKSCLGEHLEAYNVGDYVPLMGDKDIQLEQSSEV
ncbi:hypothetical protein MKW98_032307 [Papaver atlanticum]|uniref:Transmembrane protein n=1 Tax=Papaver atlanticum TaxID=357466 RepID=A0AAD4SEY5_9MAGN|nr:hypothetical protein MKW98_032307 [Papaver atlanticum]